MEISAQLSVEAVWLLGCVLGAVALARNRRLAGSLLLVFGILVCSNFSFAPYLLGLKNLFPVYDYASSDGGFEGYECLKSTACYWPDVLEQFEPYAKTHPGVVLYRLERRHLLAFWNWYDYATHPRWRLPYHEGRDAGRNP